MDVNFSASSRASSFVKVHGLVCSEFLLVAFFPVIYQEKHLINLLDSTLAFRKDSLLMLRFTSTGNNSFSFDIRNSSVV